MTIEHEGHVSKAIGAVFTGVVFTIMFVAVADFGASAARAVPGKAQAATHPGAPLGVCPMTFTPSVRTRDARLAMDRDGAIRAGDQVLAHVAENQLRDGDRGGSVLMEIGSDDGIYGMFASGARFVGDDMIRGPVALRIRDDGHVEREDQLAFGRVTRTVDVGRVTADAACLRSAKRSAILMVVVELARPLPLDM